MVDLEVIATHEHYNTNLIKLENVIHRVFDPAPLDIALKDYFRQPDQVVRLVPRSSLVQIDHVLTLRYFVLAFALGRVCVAELRRHTTFDVTDLKV